MTGARRLLEDAVQHALGVTAKAAAAAHASDWDDAVTAWVAVLDCQAFSRLAPEAQAALLDRAGSAALQRAWLGAPDAATDAARAAGWYRNAAASAPSCSPLRAMYLSNLGVALREVFALAQDDTALAESIDVLRAAASLAESDTPTGVTIRLQLGKSLRERFHRSHRRDDLLGALHTLRDAASAADSVDTAEPAECHEALGNSLVESYSLGADASVLDDAVHHLDLAAGLLALDDPDHAVYTSNLASARLARFDAVGRPADLAAAIDLLEAALALTTDAHGPSAALFVNLGNALARRSAWSATRDDVDRAVEYLRRALRLSADSARRPAMLSNLAAALLERFDLTGQVADVDEAIDMLDDAVAGSSANDVDLGSRLNNLAIALRRRQLRRRGGRDDLDRAVAALERAEAMTSPGDPDGATLCANLGNALHQRFDVAGDRADLDRAVAELDTAVAGTPAGSPDRSMYLNNLGATLAARAARFGDHDDLRRAADVSREAVDRATASVYRVGALVNLGNATSELFDVLGDPEDRATARRAFRTAAREGRVANPADSLSAARNWSEWAAGRRAWREVLDAHRFGEQAVQRLFQAQFRRSDQESWLRDADGLATLGAFAHATRSELEDAVLALETGRAVISSQLLELGRGDVEALGPAHAALQQRFASAIGEIRRLQAET